MNDELKVIVVEFGRRSKYMMRWNDPVTGERRFKASKVERDGTARSRRDAEREAGAWQAKLREGGGDSGRTGWAEFRKRYESEVIASKAEGTAVNADGTFNLLEAITHPKRLADLSAIRLSGFQAALRQRGRSEDTIKRHLAYLLAALRWAKRQKLIREVPSVDLPKRVKGSKSMKGRPITGEEFDRLLAAVPKVRKIGAGRGRAKGPVPASVEEIRKRDCERWERFLRGLWLSGLRLSEGLDLRWDRKPGALCVDLEARRPMMFIPGECQKSGKDQQHPIAPEFASWLAETPKAHRRGLVFDLQGNGRRLSDKRAGKVISAIGEHAGIVVDRRNKLVKGEMAEVVKYASAHDLRRAFGERWASRIMPKTLQELMRHEAIETTMRFYVGRNAEATADALWDAIEREKGNTKGNTAPTTANQNGAPVDVSAGVK